MTDTKFMLPDQPDGIDEQGRELPDPSRAARRVRAYVTGAGDGLYDTADPGDGPRPLYGRDLESICRALDARTRERDAALARADAHRVAAHEAAGQLDALRTQRDALAAALAALLHAVESGAGWSETKDAEEQAREALKRVPPAGGGTS